jgi:hypothetical protein
MEEMKDDDPESAVRAKARLIVRDFCVAFDASPPFNLEAMASFRGLRASKQAPRHSKDSEIAPIGGGKVELRVNRDRPYTRQRFSIGHEVGHTLFPEYAVKVQCRKAIDRDWADPNDLIEALCDVASTELLFPLPWFSRSVEELDMTADSIGALATGYEASREATVRRLVEVHPSPLAAVFFHWKWKPTEMTAMSRDRTQRRLLGTPLAIPEKKLRVDYAVLNDGFAKKYGGHIPKDKSVPASGPIHDASCGQCCYDGTMSLELGSVRGRFSVAALPIYTSDDMLGDNGEVAVVAVLSPAKKPAAR